MQIEILVQAELSFQNGKFASRDDIAQEIMDQISDPGSLTVNEGEYNVDSWDVNEHASADPMRAARERKLIERAVAALEGCISPQPIKIKPILKLVADLRKAFNILDPVKPAPGTPAGE